MRCAGGPAQSADVSTPRAGRHAGDAGRSEPDPPRRAARRAALRDAGDHPRVRPGAARSQRRGRHDPSSARRVLPGAGVGRGHQAGRSGTIRPARPARSRAPEPPVGAGAGRSMAATPISPWASPRSLWWFWHHHGDWSEGRDWLEQALRPGVGAQRRPRPGQAPSWGPACWLVARATSPPRRSSWSESVADWRARRGRGRPGLCAGAPGHRPLGAGRPPGRDRHGRAERGGASGARRHLAAWPAARFPRAGRDGAGRVRHGAPPARREPRRLSGARGRLGPGPVPVRPRRRRPLPAR